jgi:putative transposase
MLHDLFQLPSAALMAENRPKALRNTAKTAVERAVAPDWYSRYVLSWKLSNTLDVTFCLEALEEALSQGCPEVFNTDQGVQFTSASFTGRLEAAGARVSMDGRGRCLDNVFVERLWRTVKYEYVYLWRPSAVPTLVSGLTTYFGYYNEQRTHQSLEDRTPAEVYGKTLRSGE